MEPIIRGMTNEQHRPDKPGQSIPPVRWLEWAKELSTMAQTGLTYVRDPYDEERYRRIHEISLEMLSAGSDTPIERLRDLFAHEIGHATPKVDVRAAVFTDGKILLVRERRDGCWTLPGGWADVGETPAEATVREVREESGYVVRVTSLLALYDKRMHAHPPHPFYAYKIFFDCEVIGGEPQHSDETDGVDFFTQDNLPPLSLDRITESQILRLFELHQRGPGPADFD